MAHCRLTPEIANHIVGFIRAGGYRQIAAEAAGVPAEVLAAWLERGTRPRSREPYRSFATRVRQAAAQARLKAELAARDKDPRFWLRYGPGRETADSPGWTAPVKAAPTERDPVNLLLLPEWQQAWRLILSVLEAYPEARVALAQAFQRLALPPPGRRGE